MKKKQAQAALFAIMLIVVCIFFGKEGYTELKNQREKKDRKSTRLNSSHKHRSRMPSSA